LVYDLLFRSKFLNISEANAPLVDEGNHTRNLAVSEFPMGGAGQSSMGPRAPAFGVENFLQSYYDLKLPNKKADAMKNNRGMSTGPSRSAGMGRSVTSSKAAASRRKKDVTTTFDEKNPNHMVEKIDLSNFRGKNFSRAGFREFLEGIEDMRCLSTIILSNNGINDDFIEELGIM
jgi:hypothetical protein